MPARGRYTVSPFSGTQESGALYRHVSWQVSTLFSWRITLLPIFSYKNRVGWTGFLPLKSTQHKFKFLVLPYKKLDGASNRSFDLGGLLRLALFEDCSGMRPSHSRSTKLWTPHANSNKFEPRHWLVLADSSVAMKRDCSIEIVSTVWKGWSLGIGGPCFNCSV